jgi:hypothetical protein
MSPLMKSSNSQIEQLKLLLSLEEKRAGLHDQIGSVSARISSLKQQLLGGAATSRASASTPKTTSTKSGPRSSKPAKAGRGELKSRIFSALENAGSAGVKVLDLARSLNTNPANIYAWFHAAVKRYPQIKKVGSAEYRLNGAKTASSSKQATTSSRKPQSRPTAVRATRTTRSSRGAKGGSKRGALQAKIIDALRSSGSGGIRLRRHHGQGSRREVPDSLPQRPGLVCYHRKEELGHPQGRTRDLPLRGLV